MRTVTIFTGTNISNGAKMLNGDFNDITWWSDNYETLAHYYEGSAIEIIVRLNPDEEQEYIVHISELNTDPSKYTYGMAEMNCPKGAIWYSFSASYLKENIINIKEIFPDLSMYDE